MGGKSGESQTSTQSRQIPDFLREPLGGMMVEGANMSRNQLQNLERLLDTSDSALVQPFDPAQEEGQRRTLDLAETIRSGQLLNRGQDALLNIAGGDVINEQFPAVSDRLMQQSQLPGQTVDTLESSASGDFLFGNEAFDEAVDASIRAAQPQIASTFAGQGGRGAIDSGLAQTAMQQVASDAFARQFGQERQRQQAAASQLANLGLQQQQQNLQGPLAMGDILQGERQRQAQVAQQLPQMSLLGPELFQRIGQQRQQQAERELREPIVQRERLIQQAMGAANPLSMIGQQQTTPAPEGDPAAGALGGGLSGAQIGGMIGGPHGAAIGAIGGGLLGGLSG